MPSTELTPFQGYLSSNQSTLVQLVELGSAGTIELIYDAGYLQLAIINKTTATMGLSTNIEFWDASSGNIYTYPINFTLPAETHVYLNAQSPLEHNPLLSVQNQNTTCFFKDLSIVDVLLKTSIQWDAVLKRMVNNENRLMLQGSQISTIPVPERKK